MADIRQDEAEDLWAYGKRLRFVREMIGLRFGINRNPQIRILDVGCGNGSQLSLPLANDKFEVLGIDTHEQSVEHARGLAEALPNAVFHCGRLEELPKDERFDVVILSEVLEHLAVPEKLLVAAVARMQRNGIMIVTVPNGFGEFEIDSWIFRTLRLQRLVDLMTTNQNKVLGATDNLESGHIQFFTRKRLHRLFTDCGLTIIDKAAGSLLAGPLAGHTLARSNKFIKWNARITDRLPFACASDWYFALQHKTSVLPD